MLFLTLYINNFLRTGGTYI